MTGVGGPAGRAGARWLLDRGHRVVGTDSRPIERFAGRFRVVPLARDPSFPGALLEIAEGEDAALIVPTVTEELPVFARLRPALRARRCAVTISEPLAVDVANDKLATAQALAAAHVRVPRTFPSIARDEAIEALGFPLLSKPRFGRGGRGVLVHRAPADLARVGGAEVVWQEFLPGEELDVNLFVDRGASAGVVLRKTALRGGVVGNALGVERVDRPRVLDLALRAARALRLEGPLDVDVRASAEGEPAILEVNARLGANVLSAPEVLWSLERAWRDGRCA